MDIVYLSYPRSGTEMASILLEIINKTLRNERQHKGRGESPSPYTKEISTRYGTLYTNRPLTEHCRRESSPVH